MEITVEVVQQEHIRLFEELAKALGLKIKKNFPTEKSERQAIVDAIERIEMGNEKTISMDIESLRKMVYENPGI